jgi:site-specific DNA-methyltransferase (adenine-specific)
MYSRLIVEQPVQTTRPHPYFDCGYAKLYFGDALQILPWLDGEFAACVTDPPYGDTSLQWDKQVNGWSTLIADKLSAAGSLWCFGSLRFFMTSREFADWKLAQEIVWEKHNGSSFHADRFKRVHELVVQFYRGVWADVYKSVVTTPDAVKRATRRKQRPQHMGQVGARSYLSEDGGPRIARSVIYARSCHGHAIAPTQKPIEVLRPLIEYSAPPGTWIIDPFCGGGSILIAAASQARLSIGIDNDEQQLERTAKRLEHFVAGGVDECIANS